MPFPLQVGTCSPLCFFLLRSPHWSRFHRSLTTNHQCSCSLHSPPPSLRNRFFLPDCPFLLCPFVDIPSTNPSSFGSISSSSYSLSRVRWLSVYWCFCLLVTNTTLARGGFCSDGGSRNTFSSSAVAAMPAPPACKYLLFSHTTLSLLHSSLLPLPLCLIFALLLLGTAVVLELV